MNDIRTSFHLVSLAAVRELPVGKPAGHDLFLGDGNLHRPEVRSLVKPGWLRRGLVELTGVATLDNVEGTRQALATVPLPNILTSLIRKHVLGNEKAFGDLAVESWPMSDDSSPTSE